MTPSPPHASPIRAETSISAAFAAGREDVLTVARAIHADPEIAFSEHRAHDRCADLLEGPASPSSAASRSSPPPSAPRLGTGSLVAALCVEYDALPEIGHGCGHNLIAGASLGAALALATSSTSWT